jgi:hypothetical protein
MKHQRHFDTREVAQRDTALIWKMVGELDRSVELLNVDISAEEARVRIFDRSDAAYPILARSFAARRANLMGTIAVLKERLPRLDQAELLAEVA